MRPRVEVTKRILLINAGSSVLRHVLVLAAVFWMHPYLARRLDPEEYALHPLLFGIIGLTPLVSSALASGLGRYLTEAYAQDDDRRVTEITSTMTPILMGISLVILVLGLAFAWKIEAILAIDPSQVETAQLMFVILLLPIVPRIAFGPYLLGFFIRQKLMHRELVTLGAEFVRVAVLVYLLTVHEARVIWVAVASVVQGVVEFTVVVWFSRRLVPALRFRLSAVRRRVIRPVLTFGWWTVIGQASTVVRQMLYPIFLQRFAGPTDVVAFNLGSIADRHLRKTVTTATDVAKPAATALVATGQDDRLRRIWFRMSRYALWVSLAAVVPLVVYRREFFELWIGEETFRQYKKAPLIMAVLLVRFVAMFPESGIHMLAVARTEMRSSTLRLLLIDGSTVAVTLLLVGSYHMGDLGAALATTGAALILHPLLLWSFGLRLTNARLGEWLRVSVLHGIVPGILATPVWYTLQQFVRPDTWLELIGCGLAGGVVYVIALLITLRPEEREDLAHLKQRIAGRLATRMANPSVSPRVDPEEAGLGWGRFGRKDDLDSTEEKPG